MILKIFDQDLWGPLLNVSDKILEKNLRVSLTNSEMIFTGEFGTKNRLEKKSNPEEVMWNKFLFMYGSQKM